MDDNNEAAAADLKSRKEAFVTGHEGSNHPWEVLWVCSSVLWGCWLYAEVALAMLRSNRKSGLVLSFVAEAAIIWLPVILSQTNFLYPFGSFLMVERFCLASILCWRRLRLSSTTTTTTSNAKQHQIQQPQLLYLTFYRSSIYFLTFVAILAVDFPLFPRRFCKTEIQGYGLMDVGAASFVISSGIVSGKAYTRTTKTGAKQKHESVFKPLFKAAPLILIGIIRTITNKELEYQEHVSEYGVHWNFFFTLGVLAVVPTIRKRLLLQLQLKSNQNKKDNENDDDNDNDNAAPAVAKLAHRWVLWSPLVAMLLYQYELVLGNDDANGLQAFVLSAPRSPLLECNNTNTNALVCMWMKFFYANREGILGCIGYSFLHAFGEWVGQNYVFVVKTTTTTTTNQQSTWPLARITAVSWIALLALDKILAIPVSRRTTNLSFCMWAIAHNLTILLGFRVIVGLCCNESDDNSGRILGPGFNAVNAHGMVSFLVANLLTGLCNLLVATIDQGDYVAMGILILYLLAVGGAALLVDAFFGKDKTKEKGIESNNNKTKEASLETKKTN